MKELSIVHLLEIKESYERKRKRAVENKMKYYSEATKKAAEKEIEECDKYLREIEKILAKRKK